ncbi:MAG: DEAD/DEAH box helicase [bacterium]|nr:DEAD/DEAH box helicase [bacterium]
MTDPLSVFHPLVAHWFRERLGEPTEPQRRAWPVIAAGRHVLISSPTGSGKTLTAFLFALDRLIQKKWKTGRCSVLYVSPLKALNNDVQRNLIVPLDELREYFHAAGEEFPDIHAAVRSGDTPYGDRARMLRRPPEILITTPESLNLILASPRARTMLHGVQTIILDEIHSVAEGKRGVHLITAVDRLTLLAGEFQRIALSATVKPLETIAEWAAGRRIEESEGGFSCHPRPVEIVDCTGRKRIELDVRRPPEAVESSDEARFWAPFAAALKERILNNRSTLVFTNSRRLCERLSALLNEGEAKPIAYAHHGSLSRETRAVVEDRMKQGVLPAIIATSSLELGIDIGALDEVLMVQAPPGGSAALQRIGRAGHGVGQVSRGSIFTTHGLDLVLSAVAANCVQRREVEPIRPVTRPLDMLAQTVVAMTGVDEWTLDGLYAFLLSSAPYFNLSRREFDLTINMLEGRYGEDRPRYLKPLISVDRIHGTARARDGALRKIYMQGGTIPDRGAYALRHRDTLVKFGELDEEFVWERTRGNVFVLGAQSWKIFDITHNDVIAAPVDEPSMDAPFWRADGSSRPGPFADRVAEFLERAERDAGQDSFKTWLLNECCMDESAAAALIDLLVLQKQATRASLPHRHHLVIENTTLAGARSDWRRIVIHSPWGGRINRPLALAMAALWEERYGSRLEMFCNDDALGAAVPGEVSLRDLLFELNADSIEGWLRKKLESSGFFGSRFRQNAARALLLPRGPKDYRTPLWLHRLRSQELLATVRRHDDFPILLETWRECLNDEFDLPGLRERLNEIQAGNVAVTETRTEWPSPFARGVLWLQTNDFIYRSDASNASDASNLRGDLLKEIIFDADLRPRVEPAFIDDLEKRLQRRAPGYTPASETDLFDWLKERMLIPADEWIALLDAMDGDSNEAAPWLDALSKRAVMVEWKRRGLRFAAALETLPATLRAFGSTPDDVKLYLAADVKQVIDADWTNLFERCAPGDEDETSLEAWLGRWITYYGPLARAWLRKALPVGSAELDGALNALIDDERVIAGALSTRDEDEICDAENLERLLRLKRRQAAPRFQPLPVETLPLYLARQQNLAPRGESSESLPSALEPLLAYPAPAAQWERDLLPARIANYQSAWLDSLMYESGLLWLGCGEGRIAFCFADQIELLSESSESEQNESLRLFPAPNGKYDFFELQHHNGLDSAELTEALWRAAWRGEASNDSFSAIRKGIASRFKAEPLAAERSLGRRPGFSRWRASRPFTGSWFVTPRPAPASDALDDLERRKDRVRTLIDRYGVVFRDLLAREAAPMRWGELFKAMRVMELSGELIGGCFFEGVPGLQFTTPAGLAAMREPMGEDVVFWMNASDPASLCGAGLEAFKDLLPERRAGNHLVYHGRTLVIVSRRGGKELCIHAEPGDSNLPRYFSLFHDWLNRSFDAARSVVIETINNISAAESPCRAVLQSAFDVSSDGAKLTLRKRYY